MNTLFIPEGGTNQYRYRFRQPSGDSTRTNIDKLSHDKLVAYPSGGRVCIIFVDRFTQGGYTYHPLRFASFIKTEEINDYLHFRVQLKEFVYPRNADDFNQDVKKFLGEFNIPKLTDADPQSTNDGYYAVIADNLFSRQDDFVDSDNAWTKCVEALKSCKAFAGDAKKEFVFVRCTLSSDEEKEPVQPSLSDTTAIYSIAKAEKYKLDIPYFYPAQLKDTNATALLTCEIGGSLKGLPDKAININSCSDSPTYSFTTKRYLEDHRDAISFEFCTNREGVEIIGTDAKLEIRIKESKWFWVKIVSALLLFSILSVAIAADYNSIKPLTLGGIVGALWWKLVFGLVQALVLFWLFKLVGKKLF